MSQLIAHTTVEFEIQLRRITRSTVFTCFVPFLLCFSILRRVQIALRPQKLACPTLSPIPRSSSKLSFTTVTRSAVFTCCYLFCPVFPLFFLRYGHGNWHAPLYCRYHCQIRNSASPHNPKCCFYLFCPVFPLFFHSRAPFKLRYGHETWHAPLYRPYRGRV